MININTLPKLCYYWKTEVNCNISIYGKSFSNANKDILNKLNFISDPNEIHKIIIKYYLGKFILIIESKNIKYIANDAVGSYRTYYNFDGLVTCNFEDFKDNTPNINQIECVKIRGYTHGNLTTKNNVFKLLPCEIINLTEKSNKISYIFEPNKSKYFYLTEVIKSYKPFIQNKRVSVAFSGGNDSSLIVEGLLKIGIKPELYFMNIIPREYGNENELTKARIEAKKFGLFLNIIEISQNDNKKFIKEINRKHESDCSFEFVNVLLFLSIIRKSGVEILLTGQNADTFINYGVTRNTHPIDTFLLYMYKKIFNKIFINKKLNALDILISKWVYYNRKINFNLFPKNLRELQIGLVNEKYYIPRFNTEVIETPINRSNYFDWMLEQKLFNHIAGNHSIAWSNSDNEVFTVIMPYSDVRFINFGLNQMKLLSNLFYPKKGIQS